MNADDAMKRARRHFQMRNTERLIAYRRDDKGNQILDILRDAVTARSIGRALSIGASYCLIEDRIHRELMPKAEFHCTDLDRRALEAFDHPGLHKQVMSATDLVFPDLWFDFIMAHQVLEHINAYPQVLRDLDRILRPGGLIYINVPNPWSPVTVRRLADGSWHRPFLKIFIQANLAKLRPDFFGNTEKYHTGFTLRKLRRLMPGYRVIDRRRARLKQALGPSLATLADAIPRPLLFLAVPTNIWILEKPILQPGQRARTSR